MSVRVAPRRASRRVRIRALSAGPHAQTALVTAVYLVTALVITWPMPAHLPTMLYGTGGDAYAELASVGELVEGPLIPFLPGTIEDFNAPDGNPVGYALYVATWASTLPKWLLGLGFGAVAGYNLYVLSGFLLSGLAMFALARRITGNPVAAAIAGWAFAFYPFAVYNALGHLEFAHGWVFVLLVWRMLEVHRDPSLRNALLAGGAAIVCISFNPYFVLLGGVVLATLAAGDLLLSVRGGALLRHLRAQAIACGMALAVLGVYAAVNATAPSSGVRSHPLSELYIYSARALQYVVPTPDTPLAGGATAGWWSTHMQGSVLTEKGLYVGLVTLALALVAVVAAATRRLLGPEARAVCLVAAVGAVAGAFSAPPTFQPGGVTIYMPSWLVFQLSSTWRVYSRFGLVVMLAVALLAAVGIAYAARRMRPGVAATVLIACALLVPLDLFTRPSPVVAALPEPPIAAVLERQPPGVVAQYPLFENAIPEYGWAIEQRVHGHPMLNGYTGASREESRALWISQLSDRRTPARLALLGVRYVLLDDAVPPPGVPPAGRPRTGVRQIARAPGGALYGVTATPARALAWPAQGFAVPEGDRGRRFAWMTAEQGELDVIARCPAACRGRLRFGADSFARPRRLRVSAPDGRVLLDRTVGLTSARFSVPLTVRGTTRVRLDISPPPQSAQATVGGSDTRSLGVRFIEPAFEVGA